MSNSSSSSPCNSVSQRKRKRNLSGNDDEPDGGNTQTIFPSIKEQTEHRDKKKNRAFTTKEHRDFVSAVFELGLKESSPAAIFAHMTYKSKEQFEGLNLERIKSKLQKYRKSKDKNKEELVK